MDSTSLGDIVTDPVELLKLILKDNVKPDFIFRRKRGKLSLFVESEESNGSAKPVNKNSKPVKLRRRDNQRWNTNQCCGNGKPSTDVSGNLDPQNAQKDDAKASKMSPSARARSQKRLATYVKGKHVISEKRNCPS